MSTLSPDDQLHYMESSQAQTNHQKFEQMAVYN